MDTNYLYLPFPNDSRGDIMAAIRKITRTKFVFADSQTNAKLTPASLVKAKQYEINDVFDADVLNTPKQKLREVRGGTPIKKTRRMQAR